MLSVVAGWDFIILRLKTTIPVPGNMLVVLVSWLSFEACARALSFFLAIK
jgi:hypothetical protein